MKKKKNHSLLLFKNALKQAFRNKIQLIGLTVLVLLSSTIFSLMQTSVARINHEYDALIAESNLHDFVIDLSNTAKLTNAPAPNPPLPAPPTPNAGVASEDQGYINEMANQATNAYTWNRVEARTLELNNNNDPKVLKIIAGKNNNDATIDKLVISEGYDIGQKPNLITPEKKQVVINEQFAQKNNLQIGDIIRVNIDTLGNTLKVTGYDINDPKYQVFNWLQIVGFGNSADFITPIIDETTPLPNKLREGILYVSYQQFGLTKTTFNNNSIWYYNKSNESISITSNKDQEIYFVGKFSSLKQKDLTGITSFFKQRYVNISDADAQLVYKLGDDKYRFNNRTSTLPSTINAFTTLLILLLLIVLLITGITVVLVTYKNIDNSKPSIGVLKSLGYSNWKILITSLAYPMIAALIGTIAVFLPASGLQILVVNVFSNYFNLNFGSFIFDGLGFLYCLILTFGFLAIIAWVISALTVIAKPIDLINNIPSTRNSKFTRFVKKTSGHRKFLTRFRLALFTSSIGKMATVSLTMFLGTVLMTTAIIGPKIMADNQKVSYTGMNYQTLTEYELPAYNSPFSFYKTYNPNLKPWDYDTETYNPSPGVTTYYKHPVRTDSEFAKELYENNINSEAYAPISANVKDENSLFSISSSSLPFLYGKMFTKGFLQGLDQSNDPRVIAFIQAFAWPEATPPYGIANQQPIPPSSSDPGLYNDSNYSLLRTFYINYRSTIAMGLNPEVQNVSNPKILDKDKLKTFAGNTAGWMLDATNFNSDADDYVFDTSNENYPWHMNNEEEFLNNPSFIDTNKRDKWIRQTMIWFYALFYNRVGQAVTQGTYTKSPYFIKQNIANAFRDDTKPFNISFNTIPYDKTTDELGTYFVGTPSINFNNNPYPMKIYGLQSQLQLGKASLMQLYDADNNSLNSYIQEPNSDPSVTNIVINETIAKQLKLKNGSEFEMNTNGKIMQARNNVSEAFQTINNGQIGYDSVNSSTPVPAGENNVTLLNQNIVYNQISNTSGGAYSNLGFSASPMVKNIAAGNVVMNTDKVMHKFKVVGVYNGYGQPSAYISKDNADKLLNYNLVKENFYNDFRHEWQGKQKVTINGTLFPTIDLPVSYLDFANLPADNPLKTVFTNEFPIFNVKLSSSPKIPDIENTFSVMNVYGDYSAIGLNGGTDITDNTIYQGHGEGSATNILPLIVHKQLLNQITQIVDAILISFIIFALIISFFIILITSDLVIYENRKVIATMKTLGYSDAKITNVVIGMYLPIIGAMFLVGFPVGWIIVQAVINYLAYNTVWVLPLFFVWWLPIVIAVIVLGIYISTYLIEWTNMKKIQPLKILNEST